VLIRAGFQTDLIRFRRSWFLTRTRTEEVHADGQLSRAVAIWFNRVVFPAPGKPDSTVTGSLVMAGLDRGSIFDLDVML
jgi:hypothetical protein